MPFRQNQNMAVVVQVGRQHHAGGQRHAVVAKVVRVQPQVMDGNFVRILSWYDNEWGFSNRMSDTAVAMAKFL